MNFPPKHSISIEDLGVFLSIMEQISPFSIYTQNAFSLSIVILCTVTLSLSQKCRNRKPKKITPIY